MSTPLLIYDFDGTLTPYAWTKFEILERCGFDGGAYSPEFVDRVYAASARQDTDPYTALWQEYLRALREAGFSLTDDNFTLGAGDLEYNPGVKDFLARTTARRAQHYILSSGLKIFLDHTAIAPHFREIHATTFTYDAKNRASGIDFLMNEQSKVGVLQQILARHLPDPTDLRRVAYLGDGITDFYAMRYVKDHGGQAIFVHQPGEEQNIEKLPNPSVVTFTALADYTKGSALSDFVEQLF